ncbi:MAG: hypothetical protein RR619_06080 [Raoultibacter sp.]
MKADAKDIATLLEMQHIDIESMRAQKQLDELPQRKQILEIRQKKQAVEQKRDQVLAMKKEADLRALRIRDETERLAAKQVETQAKIDASKGDYRSVEALSKDLNGVAKRQATLETEFAEASEKLAQIDGVKKQIDTALESIVVQESGLVASFQKVGGGLNNNLGALKKRREELVATLPDDLLTQYERVARRAGGIAIARLHNASCSVCRNPFEEGKLLQVQAEAPLSVCPSCKRMLVVAE